MASRGCVNTQTVIRLMNEILHYADLFNNIELFVEIQSSEISHSGSKRCLEEGRLRGSGHQRSLFNSTQPDNRITRLSVPCCQYSSSGWFLTCIAFLYLFFLNHPFASSRHLRRETAQVLTVPVCSCRRHFERQYSVLST